ncbi:hypothetical protein BX265_0749 [Streptomyces sp. TLI_235]|nr:hypothetical protein BX265_0749 [Streptomyces sp. TLI_235]
MSERLTGPTEQPARTITLNGLLGDSDRAGRRRLYFNKQLDYYAEFDTSDVLSVKTVDTGEPPFVGLEATQVTLRRDATVQFTQVKRAAPVDDFDLDLRLGPPPGGRTSGARDVGGRVRGAHVVRLPDRLRLRDGRRLPHGVHRLQAAHLPGRDVRHLPHLRHLCRRHVPHVWSGDVPHLR